MNLGKRKIFSRKGAKAQSATAFLKGFLCAFAPLRERSSPVSILFGESR
jgi:hypothetical protein